MHHQTLLNPNLWTHYGHVPGHAVTLWTNWVSHRVKWPGLWLLAHFPCVSSKPYACMQMTVSRNRLNNVGVNTSPCRTPFLILGVQETLSHKLVQSRSVLVKCFHCGVLVQSRSVLVECFHYAYKLCGKMASRLKYCPQSVAIHRVIYNMSSSGTQLRYHNSMDI